MSALDDALSKFFTNAKNVIVTTTDKIQAKTPAQVSALVTKATIGLGNLNNWPLAEDSEHVTGTNASKYATGTGAKVAIETEISSIHDAQGTRSEYDQLKSTEKTDGSGVTVDVSRPLIYQNVDFTQYNGYAGMLRASTNCKIEGYRIVDLEALEISRYVNGAWVITPFTNSVDGLVEFTKNTLYISNYFNTSYFIDSIGNIYYLK